MQKWFIEKNEIVLCEDCEKETCTMRTATCCSCGVKLEFEVCDHDETWYFCASCEDD